MDEEVGGTTNVPTRVLTYVAVFFGLALILDVTFIIYAKEDAAVKVVCALFMIPMGIFFCSACSMLLERRRTKHSLFM